MKKKERPETHLFIFPFLPLRRARISFLKNAVNVPRCRVMALENAFLMGRAAGNVIISPFNWISPDLRTFLLVFHGFARIGNSIFFCYGLLFFHVCR